MMEAFLSAYDLGIVALWLICLVIIFKSFPSPGGTQKASLDKQASTNIRRPHAFPPTRGLSAPSWIFVVLFYAVFEGSLVAAMAVAVTTG
jgi:hypothetical protein